MALQELKTKTIPAVLGLALSAAVRAHSGPETLSELPVKGDNGQTIYRKEKP
jgi:hypothetical protein